MPNNFGFDPIPFHLLQQREHRHVMVALEHALCTAAGTSSPFPLIWTKPGQAVAPASSPRPPLYFPSRISKDGATSVEIVHRLLHLRSPSPLSDSSRIHHPWDLTNPMKTHACQFDEWIEPLPSSRSSTPSLDHLLHRCRCPDFHAPRSR
ncbi:Os06g0353700 [Oryza sativa Japonica Group]|nr:Os06g0353700 [Oryza sativa Japonica Group]|eukprot:NP_001174777.1 Os06g0353700 [Oryza sativa Japonica Group]